MQSIRPLGRKGQLSAALMLAAVGPLSSCAAGPDYQTPSKASLALPDRYYAPVSPARTEALATWWQEFNDPQLTAYIHRALDSNLDIAQSAARLRQARESLVRARAQSLPSLSASGGARESHDFTGDRASFVDDNGNVVATGGRSTTTYSAGIDASWNADLFGEFSRSIEASRADLEATGLDLVSVQTAIVAELALNYIQARSAQASIAIARDTLATQDDNLQIARWRVQAGLVSSLDVEQARTQQAQTAATIPQLEANFAGAANRLAVLMGSAPGSVTEELQAVGTIPMGPDDVAAGIPADTLRQRPDVRSAERALAAATARIGVAQAQLYPSLGISGTIGASALSVSGLVDAITGSLFAGLSQLIFDGGATQSAVRSQRAAAQGAFAAYRQSVLLALEDVENALVSLDAAKRREAQFAIAQDAAATTAILARSQYQAGLTDFQTLLDSERQLLSARDSLSGARAAQSQAFVQLYLALGGGWDPSAPLPDGTE